MRGGLCWVGLDVGPREQVEASLDDDRTICARGEGDFKNAGRRLGNARDLEYARDAPRIGIREVFTEVRRAVAIRIVVSVGEIWVHSVRLFPIERHAITVGVVRLEFERPSSVAIDGASVRLKGPRADCTVVTTGSDKVDRAATVGEPHFCISGTDVAIEVGVVRTVADDGVTARLQRARRDEILE